MTVLARQAEETGMNGGLGVALNTLCRRTFEHFILMARLAFNLAMHSFQWEEISMIKITQTIHAIMAVKTVRAEAILMLADEIWSIRIL